MSLHQFILIKNLGKSYPREESSCPVISQVDFQVGAGDTCAIIGPSGSGKSTLLNILGLLDFADEGEYLFMGQSVGAMHSDELAALRKMQIGFVFQNFNLIPRLSVIENVALPLRYRGIERTHSLAQALQMLQRVGMAERAHYKPADLSGGQKQRVAIARALVGRPSLILADEPTGSLDARTASDILALLLSIQQEQCVTLLVVTHDPQVARLMNRQVRVHGGRVEEVRECDR